MKYVLRLLKNELKMWQRQYIDDKRWSESENSSLNKIGIDSMKESEQNINELKKAIKLLSKQNNKK